MALIIGNLSVTGGLKARTNSSPVWSTAATLTSVSANTAININLVATDPENDTVVYTVAPASSLPSGVSLSTGGALTSGSGLAGGVYTFTVRATDSLGAIKDRTFSLTSVVLTNWTTWNGSNDGTRFNAGSDVGNMGMTTSTLVDTDVTMVIYYDSSAGQTYAQLYTTSGKVITQNTRTSVYSSQPKSISCTALDATRVLFCYVDASNHVQSIVLTISGTSISVGSVTAIDSTFTSIGVTVVNMSTNVSVVTYFYNTSGPTNHIASAVITTNTNTISSVGTIEVTDGSSGFANITTCPSSCKITSTKLFVIYGDGNNRVGTLGKIITVSGTTVTSGTPLALTSVGNNSLNITRNYSCCTLDSTHVAVTYSEPFVNTSVTPGRTRVLSISGTTLTAGTEISIEAADTEQSIIINNSSTGDGMVAIDASTYAISYSYNVGTSTRVSTYSVSGTTASRNTPVVINGSITASYHSMVKLDANRLLNSLSNGLGIQVLS